jgi:hypothetical protein
MVLLQGEHVLPVWIPQVANSCAVLISVWFFIQYLNRKDKLLEAMEQRSSAAHLEAARLCKASQDEGHVVMRECMSAIGASNATLARSNVLLERLERTRESRH